MNEDVRAAVIAVVSEGGLLLVRRVDSEEEYPGHWVLPGGQVEQGEEYLAGAIRELREETGLIAGDGELTEFLRVDLPLDPRYGSEPVRPDSPLPRLRAVAYRLAMNPRPRVRTDPTEHSEHTWVDRPGLQRLIDDPGVPPGTILILRAAVEPPRSILDPSTPGPA